MEHPISAAQRVEQRLTELLKSSGWRVEVAARRRDIDVVARRGALRYAVEIKFASEARRLLLEGVLASAILRARVGAIAVGAAPLAVVCAPSISDLLLRELGEFVERFGQGTAWGAMDDSGLAVFHGPGLDGLTQRRRQVRKAASAPRRSDILSDLGQWMLKVLLSHRLPPELQLYAVFDDASIDEPIANARALARAAAVSIPTAFRFIASLKQERFLLDDGVLQLVRVDDLFDHWRAALKRRPSEARARWLFPSRDASKQLDDVLRKRLPGSGQACLGLFAACDRLGFRFVSGVAPHLYLEKISVDALERFGLRLAEDGEHADVMVREPRFPESVFRGAIDRDGVPVADVLQCWLDVADNPTRGDEMAAHLFERVIRPRLLEYEP